VVSAEGWGPLPSERPEDLIGSASGLRLDAGDQRLELRWRVLPDRGRINVEYVFWAASEAASFGTFSAPTLAPGDELLHACLRATQWEPVAPFRWLADARTILKATEGRLDWNAVQARAEYCSVTLAVSEAMRYLRDNLDASIPPHGSHRLYIAGPPLLERLEHRLKARKPGLLGRLPDLTLRYLRASEGTPTIARLRGLLGFLRQAWKLKHRRDVPVYLVHRAFRRAFPELLAKALRRPHHAPTDPDPETGSTRRQKSSEH
jgi:Uncharacterised nucleotidyltransferase